jgi:hypothetical protein
MRSKANRDVACQARVVARWRSQVSKDVHEAFSWWHLRIRRKIAAVWTPLISVEL